MAMVGRIARPHGNRGQVIVNPETDFPASRFRPGARLFTWRAGRVEEVVLTSVRFHRERPIVGIEGVGSMDDAERLAG
jgi:16S rRNA processing protein RimM